MAKCYRCNVEYVKKKCSYEQYGVIIPDVDCEVCPKCGERVFGQEQAKAIYERIARLAPKIRVTRRVSRAGKRPAVYLPEVVVESTGIKPGDEVTIYVEGTSRIVLEAKK